MTYTPGKADADAVFDLAHIGMLTLDWVVMTSGKHTLTIHTRNGIERNVINYRAITAVRFEGKVGGPERVPRITTTGKVKVLSPWREHSMNAGLASRKMICAAPITSESHRSSR